MMASPSRLRGASARGASARKRALVFRELAGLLGAGVPMTEALSDVQRIVGRGRLADALGEMRAEVGQGSSLHVAMSRHQDCFEPHQVTMVRAAERTGTMAPLLEQLADRLEVLGELRAEIVGGLAYPALMALLSCLLMPVPTAVLEGLGAYALEVGRNLALYAAMALFVFRGLPALWARPELRAPLLDLLERLPGLRTAVRARRYGLVFGLLSAALRAGLPLPEGLRLATRASGEEKMALGGEKAVIELRRGRGLSSAISTLPGIDDESIGVIAAGERTGALDDATARRAHFHERRYRSSLHLLGKVVQVGGSLLIALAIGLSVAGRMERMLGDPMSMMPAAQRHDLERELERAQPHLPVPPSR